MQLGSFLSRAQLEGNVRRLSNTVHMNQRGAGLLYYGLYKAYNRALLLCRLRRYETVSAFVCVD